MAASDWVLGWLPLAAVRLTTRSGPNSTAPSGFWTMLRVIARGAVTPPSPSDKRKDTVRVGSGLER